jgi:cell division protease FtsH
MAQNVTLVSKGSGTSTLKLIMVNALPILLIFGLIVWMSRRAAKQAGGLLSIGRSRARRFEKERTSVTFKDVAGVEEAKEGLKEIISFLKEPQRFRKLGCRVPKGVLLVGPPGTGKTLLARATAGEAGVPFYSITGSDFVEMFVGVGASRVRDLFQIAKRNTPCIIFLDELDSVGRHRGAGLGGGHDEREQTLNQLLSEIDGFEPMDNLVVLAATNRPDVLDPALLRPGRFDRRVTVDLPALKERVEILRVHAREVPMAEEVDMNEVAASMPGRSGADLSNLINEAALLAAKRGKDSVGKQDITDARDRILMGQLRGGIVLRGREKKAIAVHEAGHALVAHLTPEADPVEKISIIPRGRALGATQQLPEERYNYTEEYMRGRLKVMLAGRAGEQVVLETVSTGAADDLSQASRLARHMVGQWGMGQKFRNMAFDEDDHQVFLGEQLTRRRDYSEQTARDIDMEIKALIEDAYEEAETTIKENRDRLEKLAGTLEKDETIEGEALEKLLGERAGEGD